MSPELRADLAELDLSQRAFCAVTGLTEVTTSGWCKKHHPHRGVQREPPWARLLVKSWKACPELLVEALVEARQRIAAGD
jgi:hypothetical protein